MEDNSIESRVRRAVQEYQAVKNTRSATASSKQESFKAACAEYLRVPGNDRAKLATLVGQVVLDTN